MVNKSKTTKSVQHLKDYLKSSKQASFPKASLPKAGQSRKPDKTVCSEEELKAIQKEHGHGQSLSLNKPYLKSATDLLSLTRTKLDKSEKKKKS